MNKKEFMNKHNITVREVTEEDLKQAITDYQRSSNYIITYDNKSYFSHKATMKDLVWVINLSKEN